jgi:hypothetical protein
MPILYAIVPAGGLDSLDFRPFLQDNPGTCRKSVDGSRALISYSVNEYPIVESRTPMMDSSFVEFVETGLAEMREVFEPRKVEIYGQKEADNSQTLAGIQEAIPFSAQILGKAFGGASKPEIKGFVRDSIVVGDITLPESIDVQTAIVNYDFKVSDPKVFATTDEFGDVIELDIDGEIIFKEGNPPSTSTTKSKNQEIVYRSSIDQYGNLSRISKETFLVEYKDGDRVDEALDTTLDVYNEEGDLIGTDVIENGRKIGSRHTEEYTVDEIRELMSTPEWKHPDE